MFGKNINCDFGSLISHLLDPTKKERKKKEGKDLHPADGTISLG